MKGVRCENVSRLREKASATKGGVKLGLHLRDENDPVVDFATGDDGCAKQSGRIGGCDMVTIV